MIQTTRLILRPITFEDAPGLFEMDSSAAVHRYLGQQPVKQMEEIIEVIGFIHQQYQDHGMARWAVIDKQTQEFLGWSGLKWITEPINEKLHYYDLGYRFKESAWGKGYATEAAQAWVNYARDEMQLDAIFAIADPNNTGSCKVLQKTGFTQGEIFNWIDEPHLWFSNNFKQ